MKFEIQLALAQTKALPPGYLNCWSVDQEDTGPLAGGALKELWCLVREGFAIMHYRKQALGDGVDRLKQPVSLSSLKQTISSTVES